MRRLDELRPLYDMLVAERLLPPLPLASAPTELVRALDRIQDEVSDEARIEKLEERIDELEVQVEELEEKIKEYE